MEQMKLMTITPEMAKEWLDKNPNNRTIKAGTVKLYAEQMRRGDWDVTGQAISLDVDGNIIDGQHRLAAIVFAKVPVTMFVATGLRRSMNYDNGVSRNAADAIKIVTGESVSKSLTATATLALNISDTGVSNAKVPVEEQYRWIQKHRDTIEALSIGIGNKRLTARAPVMYAAICAAEAGVSVQTIKGWLNVIATGAYEQAYQYTAVRFRDWLINASGRRSKETFNTVAAAETNIINYANKKLLKNIRVPERLIFKRV